MSNESRQWFMGIVVHKESSTPCYVFYYSLQYISGLYLLVTWQIDIISIVKLYLQVWKCYRSRVPADITISKAFLSSFSFNISAAKVTYFPKKTLYSFLPPPLHTTLLMADNLTNFFIDNLDAISIMIGWFETSIPLETVVPLYTCRISSNIIYQKKSFYTCLFLKHIGNLEISVIFFKWSK